MNDNLRTALVGLGGALIGGVIAAFGIVYSEHAENDRVEDREHRQAVAAARLLVDEYRSAGLYLERCIQTGKLQPVPPGATIRISDADRKLMAGSDELSSDEYGRASEVVETTNLSLRVLRRVDPVRGPYPLLDGAVRDVVETASNELVEGREALRPLTGEGPAVVPKPPIRRPQPGLPPQPGEKP